MTNELTPCTSDVEDSAGQKTPELPPKVLHKKHSSSSKKQTMKPKQLKFDKNMGDSMYIFHVSVVYFSFQKCVN